MGGRCGFGGRCWGCDVAMRKEFVNKGSVVSTIT